MGGRRSGALALLLLGAGAAAFSPAVRPCGYSLAAPRLLAPVAILGRTGDAVLDRSLRAKAALAEELGRARARRRSHSASVAFETKFVEHSGVPPVGLSLTGAASAAHVAPTARVIGPAAAIKGLYAAFNARDAEAAASFLSEDCVYEDLLLGPSTICRGKRAFYNAIRFHPAFVSSQLFSRLPLADQLPKLELVIDSVAEGETVPLITQNNSACTVNVFSSSASHVYCM